MHSDTMVDEMEDDFVLKMGFKDKDGYKAFLKDVGKTAHESYDKIKDKGPAFFGISIQDYLKKHLSNEKAGKVFKVNLYLM